MEKSGNDYQRAVELAKERAEIEEIVSAAREFRQVTSKIEEAKSLTDVEDDELRELALMELDTLQPKAEELEKQLQSSPLPKDPRDDRNVIMEIRAGNGRRRSRPVCSRVVPHVFAIRGTQTVDG